MSETANYLEINLGRVLLYSTKSAAEYVATTVAMAQRAGRVEDVPSVMPGGIVRIHYWHGSQAPNELRDKLVRIGAPAAAFKVITRPRRTP